MKNVLFLLTALLILSSCSKDFEKLNIESDILVSAEQENSMVTLTAETEKVYSHSGHSLIYCQKRKGNELFIHFKKVKANDSGFTVLSPAQSIIDLGELKNGEYRLIFKLNREETIGSITKTDSTFSFHLMPGGNVKM